MARLTLLCLVFLFLYCVESKKYTGTIYANQWFKLWVNGKEVAVDPVTSVHNNAVKVSFEDDAPCRTYAIYAADGSDENTGLEYGGTCVGNGGIRITISDGTISNTDWKVHRYIFGPTQKSTCFDSDPAKRCKKTKSTKCTVQEYKTKELDGWCSTAFAETSSWEPVKEYTEADVGYGQKPSVTDDTTCVDPKTVNWESSKFIWAQDLLLDNYILLRYTKCDPGATKPAGTTATCSMVKPPQSQQKTCGNDAKSLSYNVAVLFALVFLLFTC